VSDDGVRVRFAVSEGVARVTLARPAAGNAFDLAMAVAVQHALAECGERQDVRAVLISADGRDFSVGGDLRYLGANLDELPAIAAPLADAVQDVVARVAELPVPVVCAAGGAVAGAALGFLWAADVTVVGDDLRIVTGFAKVGLSGDGGSSWWLPRLAGTARARELLVEGRPIGAAEALRWGLVARVVARPDLAAEAERTVIGLASGPTLALGHMRRLVALGPSSAELRAHLAAEAESIRVCLASRDVREALRAFGEGRSPVFDGG
jgi:2-(1,2-epoxy-1,2-dihydrophenyl)acetyl-CoA isomerase